MTMNFAIEERLKALAIVVFETAKPFGDYAACVVLNDGAGISYGINQFTHRSGSLHAVAERYLENGGAVGRAVIANAMRVLASRSVISIRHASNDETLKKALLAAAVTSEMRRAQEEIAFELYLSPAIEACEGSNFVLPLSLAVVYDSINHGSWEKIRDRVSINGEAQQGLGIDETKSEREWITQYVAARHKWLGSIERLKSTRYRTRFFIEQIARGNWHLDLPLNVNGIVLNERAFDSLSGKLFDEDADRMSAVRKDSAVEPSSKSASEPAPKTAGSLTETLSKSASTGHFPVVPADSTVQPPNDDDEGKIKGSDAEHILETIETKVNSAAEKIDRVEAVVTTITRRTDAAKSLWTTVAGTMWQTAWAVCSFAVGMPKGIWLVAAVIAGILMLLHLYRQIALGKSGRFPRSSFSSKLGVQALACSQAEACTPTMENYERL